MLIIVISEFMPASYLVATVISEYNPASYLDKDYICVVTVVIRNCDTHSQ